MEECAGNINQTNVLPLRDDDGRIALAHLVRGEPGGREESSLNARFFVKVSLR